MGRYLLALSLGVFVLSSCSSQSGNQQAAGGGGNPPKQAEQASTPPAQTQSPAPTSPAGPTPTTEAQTQVLPSGLKYVDLVPGTGASPQVGQMVSVHYTGWLVDGKKFDSSVDRGQPFQFMLGKGQVIKGWDEGVASMKIGGKRKLIIPPALGYGGRSVGNGLIPPNSTLVFEVELLGVK
jgi:peptidylprolyl isomerase